MNCLRIDQAFFRTAALAVMLLPLLGCSKDEGSPDGSGGQPSSLNEFYCHIDGKPFSQKDGIYVDLEKPDSSDLITELRIGPEHESFSQLAVKDRSGLQAGKRYPIASMGLYLSSTGDAIGMLAYLKNGNPIGSQPTEESFVEFSKIDSKSSRFVGTFHFEASGVRITDGYFSVSIE